MDCRQELENLEKELKRIQQENLQLLSDARSARAYRDELDALREKAIRVDKLESEVGRYKERLHDIEFYKTVLLCLYCEDNQILLETKSMLEDQLEGSRARSDKLHELEKENLQLKAKIHDMEMERDMDRKRIEELLEENLTLEMAQKQSMDESLHLGWELEQLSKTTPELTEVPQKSLGHEVNELTSSRLLKLEMENQALLKTVEELKNCGEASTRLVKAEKENQRLCQKLEQLESEVRVDRESLRSAENLSSDLMKEKAQLQKTLETLRENSERQVKGLEQENEHLNQTVASLRQRSQVSAEARVKDVEKENRVLHDSIKETSSKLNKLEFERKQLRKDLEYYKEKGEKSEELEMEVHRLERENEGLQKRVASLSITCEKVDSLEKENTELESESRKLKKKIDALRNTALQLEALEKENAQLDEENLELRRTTESLRSAGAKAAQLELENKELESEKSQMQKSLELLKASSKKSERLEVSYQGLDSENQRLQKALENSSRKIQQLEGELQDVESENQSLQRTLEELKISSKRLEQLEQENKVLEQESSQLEKDKKQLEKENKRLRQQAEIRDSKLDDDNQRISHLEKENRALSKEVSTLKDSYNRVKDLEKENKEMVKQATIDKKTLVTLREELVSEKLKGQQINNDLEKLTHELEKIGLNKEGLLHDEESSDARFKLLESKLESTLKSSLEIKEEKIASLEARLKESSNLNQELRQELKTVKKNYEALRQREEEERMVHSSPPRVVGDSQSVIKWEKESHEATRELLKVKDRLIEVERNNATLQAEKQALRTQLKQLETQSSNLQAQILALQRQTTQLEELEKVLKAEQEKMLSENKSHQATAAEYHKLKEDNDKLNTTYQQLLKDNEGLQADHKNLKSQLNNAKLEQTRLEAEFSKLKEQYQQLDITSTKLTNQCELLSQLKGNLEEENRHLLDQIQTLMLQNRTLLEQTMESKDLFHVEQRQYIDKLNELRRQKEKLEEKIMDQYKFYDPSPPRRRGNWITLKMKKLIKPKSRERMRSLTITPTRSESSDGFLAGTSAFQDSQDSSSMGSGSLDDPLSHKRSSSEYDVSLKLQPQICGNYSQQIYSRYRYLFRLFIVIYNNDPAWTICCLSVICSRAVCPAIPTPASLPSSKATISNKKRYACAVNGTLSRPHSESSGEFSLSLDTEVWSSGSSPVQQPHSQRSSHQSPLQLRKNMEPTGAQSKRKTGSPGSEVVSLQQFLEESIDPSESGSQENLTVESPRLSGAAEPVQKERPKGRGILRSASGRAPPSDSSTTRTGPGRPTLRKAESTRVKGPSQPRPSLTSQGKATSVSERLDSAASSSAGLPRASSVISTAEGSTRRTSIHDLLSKDSRQPISVDPSPSKSSKSRPQPVPSEYQASPRAHTHAPPQSSLPTPLPKSASMPCTGHAPSVEDPELSSLQAFLGPSFTVDSVFLDSILSEPVFAGGTRNQAILSLNTSLVSNISGPPLKPREPKPSQNQSNGPPDTKIDGRGSDNNHVSISDQSAPLSSEDSQSLWYEYGCV
uniref:Coiled-coil domain containing 88A n=1 Tax=Astyanax mexicanus TaxID=7994 RepID=A0A8B9HIE5_ASTMX